MSERFGEEAQSGCPAREFQAGHVARVIASWVPATILSGIVRGMPRRQLAVLPCRSAGTARGRGATAEKAAGFALRDVPYFCSGAPQGFYPSPMARKCFF